MSAKTLNLLAEKPCTPEAEGPTRLPSPTGNLQSGSPSPPPGLEQFAEEDACYSSSGSTRFEEEGDMEFAYCQDAYCQDWEPLAWGQSFTYPYGYESYECIPYAPVGNSILSTTPVAPPSGHAVCPPMAPVCPPLDAQWMWPEYAIEPPMEAPLGSIAHQMGNCKPCAFFYTKGCQGGENCSFCHLCPPGEKDRRKKEKHIMARIRRKGGKSDAAPSVQEA
ncbi:unnamed protein product [Effrenium voratum]|nr:unnamed protein product [Effrenium voratum]